MNRFDKLTTKRIYLDYAASTPTDPIVWKAMRGAEKIFANPQSAHLDGQKARQLLEAARLKVAEYIGGSHQEVILTSGATEANRLAVEETFFQIKQKRPKPHLITTSIEHSSLLDVVRKLEKQGLIRATYLKPAKDGGVLADQVQKAIKPETFLVTIGYANNEIGTIQPVREIGKLLRKINQKRPEPLYFHTDAAQALLSLNPDTRFLKVDLMTISSHKIYGPKGAGALFVRYPSGLKIAEIGTPNLPALVGFGKAIEVLKQAHQQKPKIKSESNAYIIDSALNERLGMLKDKLFYGLVRQIKELKLNGTSNPKMRVPNVLNLRFQEVDGETLFVKLDLAGVSCSLGSACKAGAASLSHVLLALGQSEHQARSGLRLSVGKLTELSEINRAISIIKKIVSDPKTSQNRNNRL